MQTKTGMMKTMMTGVTKMSNRVEYNQLSTANIQDKRDLVISECSKGGYTIAQRIGVDEGKKTTYVYMKGAIHVDSIDGIQNLRDALNVVLNNYSENNQKSC